MKKKLLILLGIILLGTTTMILSVNSSRSDLQASGQPVSVLAIKP